MIFPMTVPLIAIRPTWMSPSMVALSPTISSFFDTILPVKRPSMRIVSSNSNSPLNTAPLSRNPFSSPLPFFIVASRSNHQKCASNHPRWRSECESRLPAAPIDFHFRSQRLGEFFLGVAREDILRFFSLGTFCGRSRRQDLRLPHVQAVVDDAIGEL